MSVKTSKESSRIPRLKIGSTTFSIYPNLNSFTLAWIENGKRIRKTFPSIKLAKEHARSVKITNLPDQLTLSGNELNEYKAALDVINNYAYKFDLDERPRMDMLIQEAISSRHDKGEDFTPKTTKEVFDLWVDQKKTNGCTQQTILDCNRAKGFIEMYPDYIHQITEGDVMDWNNKLSKTYKERTRYNFQSCILNLFNYARDFKYLPNKPHAAEILNKGNVKARKGVQEIGVWRADDFEAMLVESLKMGAVGTKIKKVTLMVAIGGFAGLRIAEIARMEWEHILWKTNYIRIPAMNSKNKTKHRRVPMCDALIKWIRLAIKDAKAEELTGRLFPHPVRYVTERIVELCKKRLGLNYVENGLRHTCITSWVAQGHGEHQAAFWAGNSGETVKSNYLGEFTKEEGEKWHSIMPPHKLD